MDDLSFWPPLNDGAAAAALGAAAARNPFFFSKSWLLDFTLIFQKLKLSENYLNVSKISIRHKRSGLQVFMVNV